ncbi:TraX family protein [Ectopseudomonas oleovorans]|uniref:TraX family protein n=1 Tax=Ectopseudomonas oleovorans TaxID=301 RepID=A0A379JZR0_ECTOL|nr:TraX family protein [Pseudomonas oleovorans]SUD58015.1 TraX family protein [Pseudomonas oleovorans]
MATLMAMPVPGIQERDHALDWVKWLALVAMVLDHLWFVLPADWQDPGYGLRVAGRLAFPLFCLAIAANVARQPAGFPVGIRRYLGGLLLFALLSQPAYAGFLSNGTHNILFTLALGLPIAAAVQHRTPALIVGAVLCVAIGYAYSSVLAYSVWGVLLPAVMVTAIRAQSSDLFQVLAIVAGVVALLANGALLAVFRELTPVQYSQVAAIAVAPLLGLLMLQIQAPPVRPVGRWMYAFYPLHLLVLISLAIAWS